MKTLLATFVVASAACSDTLVSQEDPLAVALCANGGQYTGNCQGKCTYTLNGNDPSKTTYTKGSCSGGGNGFPNYI